uniref:ENY2 transcription and export complex 2 subunit n=1 Tax=Astatotilapia calliptera TaxID=8154 RepID=A0A3P8N6Z7_ASTCA
MSKDSQMRAAINQKLIEMGERERLKELLRAKLVECGWKDQLKAHCKARCDQRKGPGACHSGGPGHRGHTKRQSTCTRQCEERTPPENQSFFSSTCNLVNDTLPFFFCLFVCLFLLTVDPRVKSKLLFIVFILVLILFFIVCFHIDF